MLKIPKLNKHKYIGVCVDGITRTPDEITFHMSLDTAAISRLYERTLGQSVIREGSTPSEYVIHNAGGNMRYTPHAMWLTA